LSVVYRLIFLLSVVGASALALFLARELKKTLQSGVAGTMRGRTYRRTKPGQYWLLVAWNILFIIMSVVFILLVVLVATGYLRL